MEKPFHNLSHTTQNIKKPNTHTSNEALETLSACKSVSEYLSRCEDSEYDLRNVLKKSPEEKINQKKIFISKSDLISGTEFLKEFPNVEEIIFFQHGIDASYKYHLFFQELKKLPTIKKIIVGIDRKDGGQSLMVYREFKPSLKGPWIDSKCENVNESNIYAFDFTKMATKRKTYNKDSKNDVSNQASYIPQQVISKLPSSPLMKEFYENFSTKFLCKKNDKNEEYLRLSEKFGYLPIVVDGVKMDLQIVATKKENKEVKFYTIGLYFDKSTGIKKPRAEIDIYPDGTYNGGMVRLTEDEKLLQGKEETQYLQNLVVQISKELGLSQK